MPAPVFLTLVAMFGLSCTPTLPRPAQPLATSLQDISPHADGDHFVYVWKQVLDDGSVRAGVQVEHMTALDNGEFEVTLSEDGAVIGYTRFRDDGHALLLLSETLGRNLQLSYDPPLPQIATPLYPGETRFTATATITVLKDNRRLETLEVTQVVQVGAAAPVHSTLADYPHGVQVSTIRTLEFSDGQVELTNTAVLVPGIGEVRSAGAATGIASLQRELACATIGGQHIGNCRTLRERVEELERAGSTDVR
jgi:hypothetical protein